MCWVRGGPTAPEGNARGALCLLRVNDSDDLIMTESEVGKIALHIEKEMFGLFQVTDNRYKSKYRSIMFNLKDPKNQVCARPARTLQGLLGPPVTSLAPSVARCTTLRPQAALSMPAKPKLWLHPGPDRALPPAAAERAWLGPLWGKGKLLAGQGPVLGSSG